MALTVSNLKRISDGSGWKVIGDLAFDSSYPTGGESLSASLVGLAYFEDLEIQDVKSGYTFEPTVASGGATAAIKVYEGGADAHSHGAGTYSVTKVAENYSITHSGTPAGNAVYVNFDNSGQPYLECNMATDTTDKFLALSGGDVLKVKHNATPGGVQIYFDDDAASADQRILAVLTNYGGVTVGLKTLGGRLVNVVHDASAATNGTAVTYDDATNERLESNTAGAADAQFNTSGTASNYVGAVSGTSANNTAGVADEVANTTDLSALTAVRFVALGK